MTVDYRFANAIATLTMDDGKVNALSTARFAELNDALDRAERQAEAVVLSGRPGVFSAGFDLPVLRAGGVDATTMLRAGFETAARLLAFPVPVVVAGTGHAMAMGLFLLLGGDYRIVADGDYKLVANEVAIGLTMPRTAVEFLRLRLSPAAFQRAVALSETFGPYNAVLAGLADRVVAAEELSTAAHELAGQMRGLDREAHLASKLRARAGALVAIREAIERDTAEPLPARR